MNKNNNAELEYAKSIHEAAHFVIYLRNCKKQMKGFHRLEYITIENQPMFMTDDITVNTGYLYAVLNSDCKMIKAAVKRDIQDYLIYALAGYAAELYDRMGKCPDNFSLILILRANYTDILNEPGSDFEKATKLLSLMGERGGFSDALLKHFRKAVREVKLNWNNICVVAELLRTHGTISGDELYSLAESISDPFNS